MLYAAQYGLTCYVRRNVGIVLNGSTVSQWSDQSGVGNHFTQATGARQPLYNDGLDFDGNNDYVQGPAGSSLISASAFTLFLVCTIDSIGTNSGSPHLNDAVIADAAGFWGIHFKSAGPAAYVYNWDGSADTAEITPTLSSKIILTARHGSGTIGLRMNNGTETTAASGNTTNLSAVATMPRGNGGDGSCLDCKIYSLAIFNTHVPDVDQLKIRSFLAEDNQVAL
jgi:hypothetical protein